ncbi:BREX-1 system phosphatase PglZ type A [Marinitoga arctica]
MNIKNLLEEKFSNKNYYENRKIVFWIDKKNSFKEEFETIEIENINKIVLNQNNFFTIKYLVEIEKPEENFLIYVNDFDLHSKENWLLDIFLYSEIFYADKIRLIMNELNLSSNLKSFVGRNEKFFKNKNRISNLTSLKEEYSSEFELTIGMISVLTKLKVIDLEKAIRKILFEELNDENKLLEDILKFVNKDDFWNILKEHFGYTGEKDLKLFLYYLFITDLSKQINPELLNEYELHISNKKINNIIVFLNHWRNSEDREMYKELSSKIQNELNLDKYFRKINCSFDEIKNAETFRFFDEIIINEIFGSIDSGYFDFEKFLNIIKTRKEKFWYNDFLETYEGLYYYLKMLQFEKKTEIFFDNIKEGFEKYKKIYYEMDFYYRKFYLNFNSKPNSHLNKFIEKVENVYNKFTENLNEMWDKHLSKLNENWNISGIEKQQDLFSKHISNEKKTAVIFSDALRYEIGVELGKKLKELPGSVKIEAMLSVIPSITSLGMAALMPNVNGVGIKNEIKIKDDGSITVKGKRISSFEDKTKLLESNKQIKIFRYKDYKTLSQKEKREITKDKKKILIYHNTVDEVGDYAKSEDDVFNACEKAIDELYNLVKDLKNNLSISNIIITADHGFIYQFSNLSKLDKLEKLDINQIILNKRFILSDENVKAEYIHKFSLSYINNPNFGVYIPIRNLRFKIQGSGFKYVHGGATPQEVIIPLIKYSASRKDEKAKYVEIELLNHERKVTNNTYILNFFQKNSVSNKFLPSVYKVYFEDNEGNIISEIVEINADLDDLDNSKRIISKKITLKSGISRRINGVLIIEDKNKKIKRTYNYEIDIAFPDEF